jgi:two-component system, NtrC family, response regulator HydG
VNNSNGEISWGNETCSARWISADRSGRTGRFRVNEHEPCCEKNSVDKLRILIAYPDAAGLALLTSMLKSLGHIIEEAANDRAAVKLMERNNIDLVLAGVDPLDSEALELLTYVRRKHRRVPIILLFPRLHAARSTEALRLGAMSVLKYPVPASELRAAVQQALEFCGGRPSEPAVPSGAAPQLAVTTNLPVTAPVTTTDAAPNATSPLDVVNPFFSTIHSQVISASSPLMTAANTAHRVDLLAREIGLIGTDPSWRQVIDLAATVASSRTSVLIVGEPGTGKSLLARLIHALGFNPDRPFITVELHATVDELSGQGKAESPCSAEGNGLRDWADRLAQASGGTIYLDEVAALPPACQNELFRELQFRAYTAGTGHPTRPGAARILMSTGENLPALIEQGRLPEELYHRISVVSLLLPPLRHRGTDVQLLAESFRAHYAGEFHKAVAGFSNRALEVLQKHEWPGNVRELEAAVRRAVALCNGHQITSRYLKAILNHHHVASSVRWATPKRRLQLGLRPLKEALEEPEKQIIIQALQAFNWNRHETARVLDVNRTTLYNKMKKYNLFVGEPVLVH